MSAQSAFARRQNRLAYAFVAPATVLIALIYSVPMVMVVLTSFTNYTLVSD